MVLEGKLIDDQRKTEPRGLKSTEKRGERVRARPSTRGADAPSQCHND